MRISCLMLALFGLALPARGGQAEATLRLSAPAVAPASRLAARGPAIRWQKSLAAAKAAAARTGKPLFLLHLFGKLDQEYC
jgi:hypothetical protein